MEFLSAGDNPTILSVSPIIRMIDLCRKVLRQNSPVRMQQNSPCPHGHGEFNYLNLMNSAAGSVVATATAVAAAAAPVVVAAAAIATAAPDDNQQDDDPAAVAAAKTVIAHTETS